VIETSHPNSGAMQHTAVVFQDHAIGDPRRVMAKDGASGLVLQPSDERWIHFVDSLPAANIFHSPAWMNLMAECYGYRPMAIAIQSKDGELEAGLPILEVRSRLTGRRWVALPFTDHCAPLTKAGHGAEELCEFLSDLQAEKEVPLIEVKGELPIRPEVYSVNDQVLHVLDIGSNPDAVFARFNPKRIRWSIHKAEKEGVNVRWGADRLDLDVFYRLHVETRHRLGVPVQPRRYFELLWRRVIDAGLGFILLAYIGNHPIAGGVFLTFNTTLTFKYAASDKNFWHLYPNNLLIWTAIQWGCENGFRVFDMGKTDVGNAGLRSFKAGWGASESTLTYSILSRNPRSDRSEWLQSAAGHLLRRLPQFACRLAGEMLYKHFA